jgi:hypothetical protein
MTHLDNEGDPQGSAATIKYEASMDFMREELCSSIMNQTVSLFDFTQGGKAIRCGG